MERITAKEGTSELSDPGIDRLPKLLLEENRRDRTVDTPIRSFSMSGKQMGLVGQGNRKDIRNAVEAANNARSWGNQPLIFGHRSFIIWVKISPYGR